ncbi:Protein trichome birefringence-like 19 [Hibiscus syriacus]|uniref:Protein trichome birefringence-like 19 n=1 Tax=Hibiscus syriacus TaxID=106335 RepID=A0A6A2YAA2_HIBSY|nr:Protein trichome birefringence-like 19 [Hibiscus syriacus]
MKSTVNYMGRLLGHSLGRILEYVGSSLIKLVIPHAGSAPIKMVISYGPKVTLGWAPGPNGHNGMTLWTVRYSFRVAPLLCALGKSLWACGHTPQVGNYASAMVTVLTSSIPYNSCFKINLYAMEAPLGRSHGQPKTAKIVLTLFVLTLVFLIIIPVFYLDPLFLLNALSPNPSPTTPLREPQILSPIKISEEEECDIFSGEWVPNPNAPYYTSTTCWAIHEHQNCMKYGRPDTEFMKWKWKPDGCELPVLIPAQFLEIVRGKSLAFVGDSVGRNQMQSLICLLSRVEYPIDVSHTTDENFKLWGYTTYNFTMAYFSTTHLVKSEERDANGPTHTGLFNLYLDESDEGWAAHIKEFDYLIISDGHWFDRPAVFYENHQIVGCHYCLIENVVDLTKFYGYRKAFRTAFRTINSLDNFKGVTILRTFAPSHFENGVWNEGGNFVKKKPFRSNETALDGDSMEFYMIQMEEFQTAQREGKRMGKKFRLMDTTQASLLRPDGHPSRYDIGLMKT